MASSARDWRILSDSCFGKRACKLSAVGKCLVRNDSSFRQIVEEWLGTQMLLRFGRLQFAALDEIEAPGAAEQRSQCFKSLEMSRLST